MSLLDNFKWTRQKNGVLDFIEIYNEKSLFGKGHTNLCQHYVICILSLCTPSKG